MAKSAHLKKTNILRLSIAFLSLLVILAAAFWYFSVYVQNRVARTQVEDIPYDAIPVSHIPLKAAAYSTENGITGGLDYYDVQIVHRNNPIEQRQLLVYKSDFAVDAKRYDVALEALQHAARISPDVSVTIGLAQVYEAQGSKEAAIAKYNEAIKMAEVSDDDFSGRYSYRWKYKVEELSQ